MAKLLVRCPRCDALWNPEGLRIDVARMTASWPGGSLKLSRSQARILDALANVSGMVPYNRIRRAIWQDDDELPATAQSIMQVQICGIRKMMKLAGFPGRIASHYGAGYELVLG